MVHGDKEVQRVKLVGPLWTTKLVLSIIRDLLLVVFLIVAIVGVIYLIFSLGSVVQSITTGLGGLGGLVGLPGMVQEMQQGGPEALVKEFQQDVNAGDWEGASAKIQSVEFLVQQMGDPPEAVQALQQLKQAVQQKDKIKVNTILLENGFGQESAGNKVRK